VAALTTPDVRLCRCSSARVTVIVPCHNEELTVAMVVKGFLAELPHARILVADNLSSDATAAAARQAGAEVIAVPLAGKGRAVRRLFEMCTDEVVIMVDGDATYDPSVARELVHRIACSGYDLVNVRRIADQDSGETEYRAGHRLGNRALSELQRRLTSVRLNDMLSGYKAMSRRFVTSLPIRSHAFQLEMEIAAHAVAMDFAYSEISAPYVARPEGSESKLSTYRDGASILRMLFRLYRDLHPFAAFLSLSVPWFVAAALLVVRPITEYVQHGEVTKFPSLIAGVAAFIVAMMLMTSGWLLERTRTLRRDLLTVAANDLERQIALQEQGAQGTQGPQGARSAAEGVSRAARAAG
jgi:glycosyltransferase involved in cell wall biosynthesis